MFKHTILQCCKIYFITRWALPSAVKSFDCHCVRGVGFQVENCRFRSCSPLDISRVRIAWNGSSPSPCICQEACAPVKNLQIFNMRKDKKETSRDYQRNCSAAQMLVKSSSRLENQRSRLETQWIMNSCSSKL